MKDRSLRGKTLFVSGGSRGIGLAIALRAARDGANVALIAKTAEPHPKIGGPLGVYGHWSGWGFGLGWWAKATQARGLASRAGSGGALSARSPPSVAEWAGSRRPSRSGA